MKIEIDQSNKIEQTNRTTSIGLANDVELSISIKSTEKQKLERYFRQTKQRKIFARLSFCVLIYLLLKQIKFEKYEIYIDREYPGYDYFIKKRIIEFFNRFSNSNLDIHKLHITCIGKSSNAHRVANFSAKGEYKTIKVEAIEIIRLLENKKSGST